MSVYEETATAVKSLYQMQANGTLFFPAANIDDNVAKSKVSTYVILLLVGVFRIQSIRSIRLIRKNLIRKNSIRELVNWIGLKI